MTHPVLIVGAGIGGLALAQVLTRHGVAVNLIEKAASPRAVGAGLILSGNALRVLDRLGLAEAAHAAGQVLSGAQLTTAAGRPLQTLSYAASGGAVGVHRAALQSLLSRDLHPRIQFGTTVRALHQHPRGVDVTFNSGAVQTFHAVIGADGLHSSVRHLTFGDVPRRYAGYTSWRFVVPVPGPAHATELWGRGCRLGLVPIGLRQTYGYVTANAPERPPGPPQAHGTMAEMQAHCAGFGGPAPALLAHLHADTPVIRTDIHEVRLPQWGQGRVTLLGDAAHAMTPNLGQGAAMALEDAWVLGQQLITTPDVPAGLARYEALRRPRVNGVQASSRLLGRAGQLEQGALRAVRDLGMRLVPPGLAQQSSRRLFQVDLDAGLPGVSPAERPGRRDDRSAGTGS
ncbi:FAD-dependent monooxygenase (plasmid) [Deinococcus taeanensis]|uniref:FAD-dependent monooxygenase n=1 Tax=Deinococcus taeanensis TaxID=2737050 RepID=UPI001CDB5FEA|nr:FAD-dependent monooxygenase [Deinococcus taeanensis]UBV45298.1 FAD-dependent monooxygenase [Deinococcus taeanensis]